MKKTLLLMILSCLYLLSGAQSLQLHWNGMTLSNNDNVELWVGDTTTDVKVFVSNTSGIDVNVWVRKTYVSMIIGTSNYFCWGQCQPMENMTSSMAVAIPAGFTDSLNFVGHYTPHGNPGTSVIRYTFYNDLDPNDSVCVNMVWHGMTGVGLQENAQPVNVSAVFPNPAYDELSLQYSFTDIKTEVVSLRLYNSSGMLVKEDILPGHTTVQKINVSDLVSGVYVCEITCGNSLISAQKVFIR